MNFARIISFSFLLFLAAGSPIVKEENREGQQGLFSPEAENKLEDIKKKIEKQYSGKSKGKGNSEEDESTPLDFDENSELSKNAKVGAYLLEGDIAPTKEMLDSVFGNKTGRKRKVKPNATWGKKIFYSINDSLSAEASQIVDALSEWERETCLIFAERKQNDNPGNYMHFLRSEGCWSYIGRTGGKQSISIGIGCEKVYRLSNPCQWSPDPLLTRLQVTDLLDDGPQIRLTPDSLFWLIKHGIIMHEIGHALGMWHEQSRPERDNYLNVNHDNIKPIRAYNFVKYPIDSSVPGVERTVPKPTITTKDPLYRRTFGQRATVSFTDVLAINKVYCKDECSQINGCQHGGYPDPNNCDRCKCPSGFGGDFCQHLASSSGRCPSNYPNLRADSRTRTLSSGAPNPGTKCFWRIMARPGQKVRLTVKSISLPKYTPCRDYLEIKNGKDEFQTSGPRLCGTDIHGEVIESVGQEMILILTVTGDRIRSHQGFQIDYIAVRSSRAGSKNEDTGLGKEGTGSECKDGYPHCRDEFTKEECKNKEVYMKTHCKAFCNFCN